MLPKARKEVLIKSLVQSIENYIMGASYSIKRCPLKWYLWLETFGGEVN